MFQLERMLPLIFSVLGVVTLFITFKIKLERDTQRQNKNIRTYFTQEQKALFARKKDIPESLFIKISLQELPLNEEPECRRLYEQLRRYEHLKLTNLKGYTNLELKQAYGMAQFEDLVQYEKSYLTFMDILVKYGSILYEKAFLPEAKKTLELALDYQCDLSKCYLILSDVYFKLGESHLLDNLAQTAHRNMNGSHYLTKVLEKIEQIKRDID
ncbi:hypothetical protein [Cellulosilyticum sp. I15G10I2]|uniref:hypothetical protein n=1 Tax=Cellulosilyticum sp. I15G10I2 TaxID=1892843 RepID=UPI00085C8F2B|nr:hypothetical protein [Cellulosilyticum sp. I15G10I2]